MNKAEKIEQFERFWQGAGPSLILIPTSEMEQFDTVNYRNRFYSPRKMWQAEIQRTLPVMDWPTDGIPTIRPNLGVIFIPSMAGQDFIVRDGQMPWAGQPVPIDQIRTVGDIDVTQTELMQLAKEFYEIHLSSNNPEVAVYHADTQGAFDIAHMLYGSNIFYDFMDDGKAGWIDELLEISLELMTRATKELKEILGEEECTMIHGHSTQQGVYFPHAGCRISEDSATLISPKHIDRFIMQVIEKSMQPFGGAFVHYCGKHDYLFERLCERELVRVIDLGNPEKYDPRWVMEICAKTNTVLHSRMAPEENEDWQAYIKRLGNLVKETGARVILRPLVFPETRAECLEMQQMWHELTA